MKIQIKDFVSYLLVERGFSQRTADAYSFDLHQLLSFLEKSGRTSDFSQLAHGDITAFLLALSDKQVTGRSNGVTSRARKLASIRTLYRFLLRSGQVTNDPSALIELPSIPIKEADFMTVLEYQQLLETIDTQSSKYFHDRDLAMITLFLSTGLRVSELVNLKVDDFNNDPPSLRLQRKGNVQQTIPLPLSARELLLKYLNNRKANSRYIFLGKQHQQMTPSGVYRIVSKYLRMAGIKKSKSGSHLLRHTCFSTLVLNNVNPAVIQVLANHSSFDTTKKYLHINNKQVQEAVETIQIDLQKESV